MKRGSPLESLLRIRDLETRSARRALAEADDRLTRVRDSLAAERALQSVTPESARAAEWSLLQAAADRRAERIKVMERDAAEAARRRGESQSRYAAARGSEEAIRRTLEARRLGEARVALAREQRAAEDLAILRAGRGD